MAVEHHKTLAKLITDKHLNGLFIPILLGHDRRVLVLVHIFQELEGALEALWQAVRRNTNNVTLAVI